MGSRACSDALQCEGVTTALLHGWLPAMGHQAGVHRLAQAAQAAHQQGLGIEIQIAHLESPAVFHPVFVAPTVKEAAL